METEQLGVPKTSGKTLEVPAHKHFGFADAQVDYHSNELTNVNQCAKNSSSFEGDDYQSKMGATATAATLGLTSSIGSGSTHTHSFTGVAMDFAVQYIDVVLCSKDAPA